MYALVDCDNCFVSCERVFQPQLKGRPVVVLSNNDGCVVARSNEAKFLGIKMGTPIYQLRDLIRRHDVQIRSSNYTLYADMSNRVMSILSQSAPFIEVYSIDEAFLHLEGMPDLDCIAFGNDLVRRIDRWVGMPVSIGVAPTRTLAKVASYYAKHYPGYRKVCLIDTPTKRQQALQQLPIEEVWGIGRRLIERMHYYGILTAADFCSKPAAWIRHNFTVSGLRTWRELNGEDCIEARHEEAKQSICTSRSFAESVSDEKQMEMYVSNFASRCASKLRAQKTVAALVTVFIETNRHRPELPQYSAAQSRNLQTPANDAFEIVEAALSALHQLYRPGYAFKRAGVVVSGIITSDGVQTQLFDELTPQQRANRSRLSEVMDRINRKMGDDKLRLGVQQLPQDAATGKALSFKDSIRHDYRSRCYTTNFDELIEVK